MLTHSHGKIQILPEKLNKINTITEYLSSSQFKDTNLQMKIKEQIKIINEKLGPKSLELKDLLGSIVEKETILAKRFSASSTGHNASFGSMNSTGFLE
jgi:hypothetical protein